MDELLRADHAAIAKQLFDEYQKVRATIETAEIKRAFEAAQKEREIERKLQRGELLLYVDAPQGTSGNEMIVEGVCAWVQQDFPGIKTWPVVRFFREPTELDREIVAEYGLSAHEYLTSDRPMLGLCDLATSTIWIRADLDGRQLAQTCGHEFAHFLDPSATEADCDEYGGRMVVRLFS